jgi:MFS family permease
MTARNDNFTPFILLCLIGFIAFFSSYLRMPVMPLYATSLGASPAQVGSINGAFMLTAGLLSIPAGLLADRTGRKLPILAGVIAVALSALLIPFCRQPSQMALVYILFGGGLAAFAPGMLSLVADAMPAGMLGQAYGWYTTAIYVAMTLGPASGGYLAKHLGLREVFFVSGCLSLAVALLAQQLLPECAPRHKTEFHATLAASAELLHNRWLCACLVATLGSCIGFGIFLTFLPLYATSRGLDPAQVGLVFAAQALTNVICRVPIGRIADRIDRRWIVTSGLCSLALALTALGQTAQLSRLILSAVLLGTGMALTYTAIGAIIAEQVPARQRGLAMGMYNSCIYLGMMAGSTTMGIALKNIGYQSGFAVAGGVALIGLICFSIMTRKKLDSQQPHY